MKELERNVAPRVAPVAGTDYFLVSGRGLLHLSVLIETIRREGYELSVGKPQVILRDRRGTTEEPFESLVVEVPHDRLGVVMELVGSRRGKLVEMNSRGEYSHAMFSMPARGLIGLRTRLLNATQGTIIMHHRFEAYRPMEGDITGRANGVLVSMVAGKAVAFGLDGLQERAEMFVAPGDVVYEGMIVGENSRTGDMAVNPTKEKKLTNMRASGSDRNILLKPPRLLTLEAALEYIDDDELVEVTPGSIRLRKSCSAKPTVARPPAAGPDDGSISEPCAVEHRRAQLPVGHAEHRGKSLDPIPIARRTILSARCPRSRPRWASSPQGWPSARTTGQGTSDPGHTGTCHNAGPPLPSAALRCGPCRPSAPRRCSPARDRASGSPGPTTIRQSRLA